MKEIFLNIKQGEIDNKISWQKFLQGLSDGSYRITAQSKRKRTSNQNAWLHAILPDIMKGLQDLGYYEVNTLEKTKAFVKEMFFKVPVTNGIETVEIIEPTSETDKLIFAERAEKLIVWAFEYMGLDIAPPGKQTEIFKD